MRFFVAKKEQKCRGCLGTVTYDDEVVVIRWRPKLPEESPLQLMPFIPLVFHVGCYIPWVTNNFNAKWNDWHMGVTHRPVRKKRGRKFLYKTREQAKDIDRLKALQRYHRKAGHVEEVLKIEVQIRGIIDASI